MRILITGAGGMLGRDVVRAVQAAGHHSIALVRAELDITDSAAVAAAVAAAHPEVVINCAAWTDVDGAEQAHDAALAVNGSGAGHVARAAAAAGAWTIHVSSDYVFDGTKAAPYVESDPVRPRSVYGRSKLDGERAVAREAPDRHTIVRSSWLFGAEGRCFPKTILRLAAQRDQLDVVCDQVGGPTFTGHLAAALVGLAAGPRRGVLHLACAGQCSWFEFAQQIVAAGGLECEVRPIDTEHYPLPAPRPAYSVLVSERGAPALPHWTEGLSEFMSLTARVAA
ncbi:MAG: dTDP-4-dehydrorhamnose reductase [Solirubrobacteraceae bacterium]